MIWGDYDSNDPYAAFADLLSKGPVHDVTLTDGHRAFLVIGYDAAREALNHADLSKDMHAALASSGEVFAEGLPGKDFARHMLSVDPPDHTRLRGLLASGFTRSRTASLEPSIRQRAEELLDALEARGGEVVDLIAGFAQPLPFSVVVGDLLGVSETDRTTLSAAFAVLLSPFDIEHPPAEAVAASDTIVRTLNGLVDERWNAPTQDLVGDLVRAAQDDQLTRQELLSSLFQVIVAGYHTTTGLIGNGVAALLAHPEQMAALCADPSLVPQAVDEFLRYDPPTLHSTFRYAARDVEIAGTVIPAGTQVLVGLGAAGRDGAHNPDPDAFDIRRAEAAHVAFGHGIHHCLGFRLARVETVIAFETLLRRFPDMRLAVSPDELRWDNGDGMVLRGLSTLPVLLHPVSS